MSTKRTVKTDAIEKHIAGVKQEEKREKRDHFLLTVFAVLFMGLLYIAISNVTNSKTETTNVNNPAAPKNGAAPKNMEHNK
jgi:hypothetical protein